MKNAQPRTTWLKDYEVSPYLIDETNLRFELAEESTLVISKLLIRNNPLYAGEGQVDLVLDGQEMLLEKLFRDGRLLAEDEFARDEESLTVFNLPAHGEGDFNFTLECHTRIKPQENTTLEGLYKSKTMFCTQCEAEGFRFI